MKVEICVASCGRRPNGKIDPFTSGRSLKLEIRGWFGGIWSDEDFAYVAVPQAKCFRGRLGIGTNDEGFLLRANEADLQSCV